MKRIIWLVFFLLTFSIQFIRAETITFQSLLGNMLDRSAIAEFPENDFVCRQASSYDRKSQQPGNAEWFANDDWSNFIRCEEVDGRREWVMMDVDGPGAVVRWWITGFSYHGVIRVYLDGADKPVLMGKADQLIGGDLFLGPPLNAETSKGRNLYLPIPYRQHCKITYDGPHARETKDFNDNLYYNINYRQYPKETDVKTFTMEDFKAHSDLINTVQKQLLLPEANQIKVSRTIEGSKVVLQPGETVTRSIEGAGAVGSLKVRIQGPNLAQAMRSTVIHADFDGQQTIWVPVGEFFGTGVGLNPYQGWWREVGKDGWMSCYWPMPFKDHAKIALTNDGKDAVNVEIADIGVADWDWNDRTMYFHASWRGEEQIPVFGADMTRMKDWNIITVKGKGVYAGDTLALFNRANVWWGEGDEKVFVDGESFPSHFGTGSEDYFGYAWGSSDYFTSPFHAQPSGAGNTSMNHTTNTRVRVLDTIPFHRSLQFDIELWHWQTTKIDYATTAYWYAFAGETDNGEVSPEKAAATVGKARMAIEGENTQLRKVTGGFTEAQQGDWGASGGKHLWWKNAQTGDELELAFQVSGQGTYEMAAQMITAVDYGRFRVALDGRELFASEDFYAPDGVHLKQLRLGRFALEKGEHRLTFTVLEPNPNAKPGNMLGVDYIELEKIE